MQKPSFLGMGGAKKIPLLLIFLISGVQEMLLLRQAARPTSSNHRLQARLQALLVAAAALGCVPCFAQTASDAPAPAAAPSDSSAQIYGIIDAGVRHVDKASAAGSLSPLTNGLNTSRIGLRGIEDLGDGLHATFRLESGFNVGTGAESNAAMFDRTAAVGLGDRSWDLKLGRQEGFGYEDAASGRTDPLQAALNFPNYASPAAAGSKAPVLGANPLQGIYTYTYGQLRFDNALRLTAGGQNWSGGVFYALGGVAGNFSADSVRAARLAGDLGPVSAEGIFQESEDASGNKSRLGVLAGTWTLPAWKFQAGVHDLHIDAGFNSAGLGNGASSTGIQGNSTTVSTVLATAKENFRETVADLAATWQATLAVPLTLAAYKTRTEGAADGDSLALVALGKLYLSKRTALYLELDHARESGQLAVKTVSTGSDATSYMFGVNHRF
jgi:predicted porin